MTHLLTDLRRAFRGLWKSPLFTALAVTSLGLGLGANTAIFTLLDQIMLRPLPVERPHELVQVRFQGSFFGTSWGDGTEMSYPMYRDLRDRNDVFDGMFARFAYEMHVVTGTTTDRVNGELVSGSYFPVLGLRPKLGRLLTPGDDRQRNAHPVAVIGHRFWITRFGARPDVLGRTITVNDQPLTVVGVAEAGFVGMDVGMAADLFVPMMMKAQVTPGWDWLEDRRRRFAKVFGRLRPGVSRQQAEASLQPFFTAMREQELATDRELAPLSPGDKQTFRRASPGVAPGFQGTSTLRETITRPLWILMAIAAGVLLIACANVAGLLLARGMGRQREVAIRLALGGSRARIVQQLLAESTALALLGATVGLLVATWGSSLLLGFFVHPEAAVGVSDTLDARVFLFTFGLTLLTTVACGLTPALEATRPAIVPALKEQAGTVLGGRSVRVRKGLVVAQVALSLLLLIGAGLFLGSLRNLLAVDPGFRTANLVSFRLSPALNGYPAERGKQLTTTLLERLSALPGVTTASAAVAPVLAGGGWNGPVAVEGLAPAAGAVMVSFNPVMPGYFSTMGIPLLRGRDFTVQDARHEPASEERDLPVSDFRVAVVNEKFVELHFGSADPIGRRFALDTKPGSARSVEIVGVVGTSKFSALRNEAEPQVFLAYLEHTNPMLGQFVTYVRTTQEPDAMMATIRRTVQTLDPNLPLFGLQTMEDLITRSIGNERLVAGLAAVFGLLATLLAVMGLYGVMAYTVAQRTREVGIRMALGADSGGIGWLFFREAAVLVLAGFVVALPILWIAARSIQSQLFGIQALNPATIAAAMLGLALAAALGSLVPARRAARIEPLRALRQS